MIRVKTRTMKAMMMTKTSVMAMVMMTSMMTKVMITMSLMMNVTIMMANRMEVGGLSLIIIQVIPLRERGY